MRRRPNRNDVLLAVLFGIFAQLDAWTNSNIDPRWVASLMGLTMAVGVAWWRAAPIPAALVVYGAFVGAGALGVSSDEPVAPLFALILTSFAVGAYAGRRESPLALVAMLALVVTSVTASTRTVPDYAFALLVVAAPWVPGQIVRSGDTTVKTHVVRILMKLGVRDRVQAVVLAYESGLVRPGGG